MCLEVAVQDLLRVHVLQRAAKLAEPVDHGELGEGRAILRLLPLLDCALDVAARSVLHHDIELALGL